MLEVKRQKIFGELDLIEDDETAATLRACSFVVVGCSPAADANRSGSQGERRRPGGLSAREIDRPIGWARKRKRKVG